MPSANDHVRRQYATDENLRIRHETHEKYTYPQHDFPEWVIQCVDWQGGERVLDVGCGPGIYYEKLIGHVPDAVYVGLDLMPTMIQRHPAPERIIISDAEQLPFPDDYFDVVMANHMLYHVRDIEGVLNEMKRVLKPDGLIVTATNSNQTMPEFQVLMRRAIVLLTRHGAATVRAPSLPSDDYSLENGTRMLSHHFYAVVRHDLPSELKFPTVEPAMAYLESTRDLREGSLPDDVTWEDVMMVMRQQINQLTKHLGELVIKKQAGVLIATNRGGFIREYVDIELSLDAHSS